MSTVAAAITSVAPAKDSGSSRAGSPAFAIRVLDDWRQAQDTWHELELEAPHSGYQRFEWQQAFHRHLCGDEALAIALVEDAAGKPQAVLPLTVTRSAGCGIASFIGGKHANYGMGLWRPAFARAMTADAVAAILRGIAAGAPARIDLFHLTNQPAVWREVANPLALLPHQPSPSFGYHLALGSDGEAVLERVVSPSSRRKMRRKERSLGKDAPLAFAIARSDADIARFTDLFLTYKALRFAELGIANVFDVPGMRDFIIATASGERPAIELCALTVGGEPVALFGGAIADGRYSGMFGAIAPGAVQRESPGEILLHHIIRDCCERGLTVFDLGTGEATYKEHLCDGTDVLFDQTIAMTARGHAAAAGLKMAGQAKRAVKQSALWPLLLKLRRLTGRRT